jgi:hypothetical protein
MTFWGFFKVMNWFEFALLLLVIPFFISNVIAGNMISVVLNVLTFVIVGSAVKIRGRALGYW